jgi:hypothetical protein
MPDNLKGRNSGSQGDQGSIDQDGFTGPDTDERNTGFGVVTPFEKKRFGLGGPTNSSMISMDQGMGDLWPVLAQFSTAPFTSWTSCLDVLITRGPLEGPQVHCLALGQFPSIYIELEHDTGDYSAR